MPDYNYPPSITYRLGDELDIVTERVGDLEEDLNALDGGAEDVDEERGDLRQDLQNARENRDALRWAVSGDSDPDGWNGWGREATVTVEAYTGESRARTLDTARRKTMGPLGPQQLRLWLIAGALVEAPWLDEDDDLAAAKTATGRLRPDLVDWLDGTLEDLNDQAGATEGN